MPGERLEDAVAAAAELRQHGIGAVLTQLGENVTDMAKADEVTRHYMEVLKKIGESKLDCHISVKLTQLGLDVDAARCHANLRSLVECARELGTFVWIDMEQHTYVDATLEIYRRVKSEFPNVGVCLQAYLYRTAADLASLIALGGGVRLVKGAYHEPASVAYREEARRGRQLPGPRRTDAVGGGACNRPSRRVRHARQADYHEHRAPH